VRAGSWASPCQRECPNAKTANSLLVHSSSGLVAMAELDSTVAAVAVVVVVGKEVIAGAAMNRIIAAAVAGNRNCLAKAVTVAAVASSEDFGAVTQSFGANQGSS